MKQTPIIVSFIVTLMASFALSSSAATLPGEKFKECVQCPEMVVIPAGHFAFRWRTPLEGRPDFSQDPKVPAATRDIALPTNFALATHDVTRGEYAAFVRETNRPTRHGCSVWKTDTWITDETKSWRTPGFTQTDRDPVVCISWEDTQAYARWLNGKVRHTTSLTDGPYRLPGWVEAEYAGSAGSATAYPWGENIRRDQANYGADECNPCKPASQGADRWLQTSPVASFPPNRFGLYDAVGNVWQWTSDCWADTTPSTSQVSNVPCRWGLLFGGSWLDDPVYLRISEFGANDRENRNNTMGFRLARDLSVPVSTASLGASPALASQPGHTFRDCPNCPLMRILPSGHVDLTNDSTGANTQDEFTNAKPSQSLQMEKPFALGVYDVTRAEFAAFVKATGWVVQGGCQYLDGFLWRFDSRTSWRHPGFQQTDRDPVVCISWQDAQAYAHWLNSKPQANGHYRLPSGAEWLYAARGGLTNSIRYYWGHNPSHDQANYGLDECLPCGASKTGKDRWDYTAPVGSFAPNDYGLYDMVGNVWQWTDDCDDEKSNGAVSTDGSPWQKGNCNVRLLFGGSFDDDPFTEQIDKIAANRNPYAISIRNYANGFRVAKTVE